MRTVLFGGCLRYGVVGSFAGHADEGGATSAVGPMVGATDGSRVYVNAVDSDASTLRPSTVPASWTAGRDLFRTRHSEAFR